MKDFDYPEEGYAVHYNKHYSYVSMLYYSKVEKDRLCSNRCCQKTDVLGVFGTEVVAKKFMNTLNKQYGHFNCSDEMKSISSQIRALEAEVQMKRRAFVEDEIKNNMLEYLI